MNVTVSGASGFIGRHLLQVLGGAGYSLHVLSRHAGTKLPSGARLSVWDPMAGPPPRESLENADVIVHLAGEPVAHRWTASTKQRIRDSRVLGTRHLVEGLAMLPRRPAALISASGVGYYGSRGDEILDESSAAGSDFLAEVCVGWEREAATAEALGMRVASIRIGMVLDAGGGALQRMLPAFRLGAGGRLGSGRQWVSWIHLVDLVELMRFTIENPVHGRCNGVAPEPVQNAEFTRELARVLKRPAVLPVPEFGLKLLFGELAQVLLASQRVLPRTAEGAGFRFRFPQLGPALADLLG